MPHGIEQNDMMFWNGEEPWHGLGESVADALDSEEACARIAPWRVEQATVQVGGKDVPGYRANIRSDDGTVLGIVSEKYVPLQTREAFAFTDELIRQAGSEARYETGGTLFGGRRVWMLAKLGTGMLIGDLVSRFICVSTGHDGRTPLIAANTDVRVVCNNTLEMANASAPRSWSCKHKGDVQGRVNEAARILGLNNAYWSALEARAEEFHGMKIAEDQLTQILDTMFPVAEEAPKRTTTRLVLLRDTFLELYETKPDLAEHRGTAWGVYNAFTDMALHMAPARKTSVWAEKRFESFIDGNDLVQRAQRAIEAVRDNALAIAA
jgi:phage/plasmid-like protein (TIGR03299 family)